MRNARTIGSGLGVGPCVVVACLALIPFAARAANDFEFGCDLMEMGKESPDFKTDDLVEHLIKRLAKSPSQNVQLEGMLVEAAYHRMKSQSASAEKRNELLGRAEALYKAFIEKGQGHRLLKKCEEERGSIKLDYARALVKAADEEPATGAEKRAEAVRIFSGIADKHQADADKARPVFKEKLKEIRDWSEKNPEAPNPPANLIGPAQKALDDYVPKDKAYVIARLEQVSAYAEGETKKTQAHELIKYCQAQIEAEDLGELKDVTMWYGFIKGRLHSLILEEKEATEAWKNALDIEMDSFPAELKKTIFNIKKLIYGDLVSMKMRAAEKDSAKYADIIEIVRSAKLEPAIKSLFDEAVGKQLIIDFAHALTKQNGADSADYEQAIGELRQIVEKGPPWSNNASRAMAEILSRARRQKIRPRLTAQQWFDSARGCFMDGQQAHLRYKEQESGGNAAKAKQMYDDAAVAFTQSVEYYRNAIGRARDPKATPLLERLSIEPQSWLEMGLAYFKMDQYYESIIAYQALRSLYKPDARKKWFPDPKENARLYASKAFKDAVDGLDRVNKANPREDGILSRTQQNIMVALALNAKVKTPFNKRLKIKIMEDEGGGFDEGTTDTDYLAGKLAMDTAKDFMEEGKNYAGGNNAKMAAQQYGQALAKYKEGADRFQKVKPSSDAYEIALYQAASCFTYAQGLASDDEKAGAALDEKARDAAARELGLQALKMYDAYEAHVAKEKDPSEEGVARRKKLGRGVKVNRTTVYYSMKDWPNVVKSCEDYLKHEKENAGADGFDDSKFEKIYFNIFRAYSHMAGAKTPPACDEDLSKAEALVAKFAENKQLYTYAIQNISNRYNNAVAQAEKAGMDKALVVKYDTKIAEYQAEAMKDKAEPTIDDYGRLLFLYEKTGRKRDAANIADKMLTTFDPEAKNSRVSDDRWPILLKQMNKLIKYNDLQKWDRCKLDHMVMLDFVYDNEGLRFDHNPDAQLPEHDKHPLDYEKAIAKLQSVENDYKDCPTVKPLRDDQRIEGKSYIQYVKDELEFRRRIIATRDLLSEIAYDVAKQLDAEGKKEDAAIYRAMAVKQIDILLEVYGNVPSMRMKSANLKFALGEYDQALDVLLKIKTPEPPTSELYIKASKRIAEVHFAKGDYRAAAQYPQFIASTAGLKSNWVEKWWPDMEDFLNKCYENGAPKPQKVEVATVDAGAWDVKTPDEKLFDELHYVYLQGKNSEAMRDKLLTKDFLFKYELIKDKISHFKEYEKLELLLQSRRGLADEKEVLNQAFMDRYQMLKEVVDVERKAWQAFMDYNSAIVDKGGIDNVPPEMWQKMNNLIIQKDALVEKLKALPEVEVEKKKSEE